MQGSARRRPALARRSFGAIVVSLSLAAGTLACGEESEPQSFTDAEITKALSLDEVQGTLAVDGDIFCEVRPALLNDSDEVSKALDRDDGLVLTSIQGNVGIQVVPPFAKDCEAQVRRELKTLDPTRRQKRRSKQEQDGGSGGGGETRQSGSANDAG